MSRRPSRKITPVLQVAAGDCAHACLSMVLDAHGSKVSIEDLRGSHEAAVEGISIKRMLHAASQFKLSGRAVRAGLKNLSALRLPAILHWNFNHYVVLESIDANGATVLDPSYGRRRISIEDLSGHYTGIAIEFWKMQEYRRVRRLVRTSLSDLWSSMRGAKRSALTVVLLSFMVQGLLLVGPLLFSVVIDQAIGFESNSVLLAIFLAIVAASLLSAVSDLLRKLSLLSLGSQLAAQINFNLVNHLLRLPFDYFQRRRLSDLMSRIDSIRVLKDALTEGAVPVFVDGVFSIITLIVLFSVSPMAAFVTLGLLLVFASIKVVTYPRMRARAEEVIDREADEQAVLMETVRGIQTVKTMNAERVRLSAWHGASVLSLQSNQRMQEMASTLETTRVGITTLDFALVTAICAGMVIDGEISLGALFAVVALRQQFQDRAYPLINRCFDFRLVGMRLQRLADITRTPPEIPDTAGNTRISVVEKGEIEINDLRYRYSQDSNWVVDGVSLHVRAGEFIAINGQSGGGKSTLIRLLIGLLAPEEGEIRIDGRILDRSSIEAYRADIAVVMQDDELFSGTIFDNISGFDPDVDIERVRAAAEMADIALDIDRMSTGYFSFIGDMGSALSGGQRQRILLARALYRQPRILFLDEGTANLDPERESNIVNALRGLGITTVCVAHRSRTLEAADKVYEMRGGRLIPHGQAEKKEAFEVNRRSGQAVS